MSTRPNGSTEMAACILVWCAEHNISTDSDYVVRWLDEYWSRRFATLDAESASAKSVNGIDVCTPERRCGDHRCPVCGAH